MFGQLSNEQIVQAAAARYESVIAAGGSAADGLNAIAAAGAALGISNAQIVGAFQATGNAAALETAYAQAVNVPVETVARVVDANSQLVAETDRLYRTQGPGGVVAAMLKRGITLEQLNNAVTASGAYVAPGDANAIVNTYRAIEAQSRAIGAQGNVQSVVGDWDRRLWTVQTYTQGAYNVPMDGVSLPPPPPPPVGIQAPPMPPESQRIVPPTAAQTLAAQAIEIYRTGGASAVVAAMIGNGVRLDTLNAAFQAAGLQPDTAAVAQVVATYRAIERQSTSLSALPNVQSARLDTATRQFVVVTNRGTYLVPADGVTSVPAAAIASEPWTIFAPPPPPTVAPVPSPLVLGANQIADAAVLVYNQAGGGSVGYQAVLAAQQAPGSGVTWPQLDIAMRSAYGGALADLWVGMLRGTFPAAAALPPTPSPPPAGRTLVTYPTPWTVTASDTRGRPTARERLTGPGTIERQDIDYTVDSAGTGSSPARPLSLPPPQPTPASIVELSDRIYRAAGGGASGFQAVRDYAEAHGYSWEQVVTAFRTVGGQAWDMFQGALTGAREQVTTPGVSGMGGLAIAGIAVAGVLAMSGALGGKGKGSGRSKGARR